MILHRSTVISSECPGFHSPLYGVNIFIEGLTSTPYISVFFLLDVFYLRAILNNMNCSKLISDSNQSDNK